MALAQKTQNSRTKILADFSQTLEKRQLNTMAAACCGADFLGTLIVIPHEADKSKIPSPEGMAKNRLLIFVAMLRVVTRQAQEDSQSANEGKLL